MEDELLSLDGACRLLGVSRPTFNKIRKSEHFVEVLVGQRARFYKRTILDYLNRSQNVQSVTPATHFKQYDFELVSENAFLQIEIRPNVFDLRLIRRMDPFGVICLLATLLYRARQDQTLQLILENNFICNYLNQIYFFDELERMGRQNIHWQKNLLNPNPLLNPDMVTSLILIRHKGGERIVSDQLIQIFQKQGFIF